MKKNFFYMLMLSCSMCLFSFATGNKETCCKKICCSSPVKKISRKVTPQAIGGLGFDLSPLKMFIPEA